MAIASAEPALGLLPVLAASQIEVLTEGPRGVTVYLAEALLGIVVAAWIAGRGAAALHDRRLRPILAGAAAIAVSLACSGWGAAERGSAVRASLRWLEFVGVLVIAADGALRGVFSRRLLLGCLAAAVVVLAGHALWDAQPWVARLNDTGARPGVRIGPGAVIWRAGGFTHPNALAALLGAAAAVLAAEALSSPRWPAALAAGGAAAFAGATVVLTYSRGGWLWLAAIGVALGAAAHHAPAPRRVLLRAGAVAAAAALLVRWASVPAALEAQTAALRDTVARLTVRYIPAARSAAAPLGTESTQSDIAVRGVDERQQMAKAVGRLAAAHPLLGAGPGQYRRAIRAFAGENMDMAGFEHHPHNFYLLILAEQGAVGLLAWGWLLVGLLQAAPPATRWPHAAWGAAWGGILGGFLLHSGFDVLVVHARGIPIAFLLGALLRTSAADGGDDD